jgi:hypothetical protein
MALSRANLSTCHSASDENNIDRAQQIKSFEIARPHAGEVMNRSIFRRALKRGAGLAILFTLTVAPAAQCEGVYALWRSQEIQFVYRGYTTVYACDALGLRVRQVLGAVGALEGTRVRTLGCNANWPFASASLQISVVSPALSTAELKDEIAKDSSRRALLDRLGVQREPAEEFPALWQSVDLSRDRRLKLESSDCELLQQLREQVFPKLAIKVLAKSAACATSSHRFRRPALEVLALMPLPHADAVATTSKGG